MLKYIILTAVLALAAIFVTGAGGCGCKVRIGNKVFGFDTKVGAQRTQPVKGILRADPRA
jgi:hypothetical protein